MPKSGQVNQKFGVYKSDCCGFEIVITKRAIFPFCPDRLPHTTIWKLLSDEDMTRLTDKPRSKPKELLNQHQSWPYRHAVLVRCCPETSAPCGSPAVPRRSTPTSSYTN